MNYVYQAYGLNCSSNVPISAFSPNVADVSSLDIIIEICAETPGWVRSARHLAPSIRYREPGQVGTPPHTVTVFGTDEFFELTYSDGTRFVIDGDAKHLWGACPTSENVDHLGIYLQGPLMGFALRRRGVTALHASAVCVDGRAVVLCGPSETGKSTTGAALALRGAPVLCDDIAALKEKNNAFQVESGAFRVCIWPDTVRNLLGSSDALPRLTPSWEKCYLPLDGNRAKFEPHNQSLGAIYIFGSREAQANAPRIENLTPREAFLHLVKNTYMNWLLDRHQRAGEFLFLSKLVMRVPVRRIIPHLDPARIGALCDLITTDVEFSTKRSASAFVVTD